jgi:PAS domain-containing protein
MLLFLNKDPKVCPVKMCILFDLFFELMVKLQSKRENFYMSEKAKNSSTQEAEIERFKLLAFRYQEIGASYGIKIYPFRGPDLPYLSKANSDDRNRASDFLDFILSVHEEALAATETLINTRQLLWRALRKYSLVPGREIFDHITDEDVVIIYNEDQKAIFWNLQFFKVSSLSVEELFFGQWFNFTRRDPSIQEKLYRLALDVITGRVEGNFIPDVPPHVVEEIDSIERTRTLMEIPMGSVLTKGGKFGGMLIIQRMKIL